MLLVYDLLIESNKKWVTETLLQKKSPTNALPALVGVVAPSEDTIMVGLPPSIRSGLRRIGGQAV